MIKTINIKKQNVKYQIMVLCMMNMKQVNLMKNENNNKENNKNNLKLKEKKYYKVLKRLRNLTHKKPQKQLYMEKIKLKNSKNNKKK